MEPQRRCFRLVGEVLVERTVLEIIPALQTNADGVILILIKLSQIVSQLGEQFREKEKALVEMQQKLQEA